MSKTATTSPLGSVIEEWKGLYSQRAYMLARMAIGNAAEANPDVPELWFLLGQTDLAVRDARKAEESFRKAADLLATRPPTFGREFASMKLAIPTILQGIERRTVVSGPEAWDQWLRNPASIGTILSVIEQLNARPIGRHEPLVPPITTPIGQYKRGGALGAQLAPVHIQVDSMKALLGKDNDLRVQRDEIKLLDSSIRIRTLELPTAPVLTGSPVAQTGLLAPPPPPAGTPPPPPQPTARRSEAPRPPQPPAFVRPAAPPPPPARAQAPPQPPRPEPVAPAPPKPAPVAAAPAPAEPANPWAVWEQDLDDLVRKGEEAQALARIDEALSRFPNSSRLLELRSAALEHFGHHDAAAASWLATYRAALHTNAEERAHRAHRQAVELARENADLLMDLAAVAGAAGSVSIALTTAKLAADIYRRRDDRPKLKALLGKMLEWDPSHAPARNELARIEEEARREAPPAWPALSPPPPPPKVEARVGQPDTTTAPAPRRVGQGDTSPIEEGVFTRTRPPKVPDSQRTAPPASPAAPSIEELRERARRALMDPKNEREDKNLGSAMVGGAGIVTFLSLVSGSAIPSIIGFFVAQGVLGQYRNDPDGRETARLIKIARTICVVGIVLGLMR
ncbi:MAG: hypothetical protein KF858_03215 [Candidatus Sumerlaeia bacterium]|nr:hypothetical protein [Candidatus Sumerlaeia bacterium]